MWVLETELVLSEPCLQSLHYNLNCSQAESKRQRQARDDAETPQFSIWKGVKSQSRKSLRAAGLSMSGRSE